MKKDQIGTQSDSQGQALGDGCYPVARSMDLKEKPLRVMFFGKAFVLFRASGEVVAFPDECPHRGYPLSEGAVCKGEIRCPYHGWQFNAHGALTNLPGKSSFRARNLPAINPVRVSEHANLIWMLNGDSEFSQEPHIVANHNLAGYFTISDIIESEAIDILENFLDPLHTHFVHPWIIRSKSSERHGCNILLTNCKNGYQAEYREEKRQTGVISQFFGGNITHGVGRIVYPGFIEIEYHSKRGIELSLVIYLHRISSLKHRIFIRVYYRKTHLPFFLKTAVMFPFQWLTYHQDKRVLEKLRENRTGNFKPTITASDIMRTHIKNTLLEKFVDLDERKYLVL